MLTPSFNTIKNAFFSEKYSNYVTRLLASSIIFSCQWLFTGLQLLHWLNESPVIRSYQDFNNQKISNSNKPFCCKFYLLHLFIMITYFTLLIAKYKIQRNGTMLSFQKTLRHQLFNIQGCSKSKDSGRAKGLILNKFFSLGLQLYLKRDSCTSIFLWISKNTFLMKYFRATASNHSFYMEHFSILLLL